MLRQRMSLRQSLLKSCVMVDGATKTHAAPAPMLSANPPTRAVRQSPDNATDQPCSALPTAPVPMSLAPWLHSPATRMKTHAVPAGTSPGPPRIAVLPSPDSATEKPCRDIPPDRLLSTSICCRLHTPFFRTKTKAPPL